MTTLGRVGLIPLWVAVMRFLGIPCRVVTNYNSAHDTNGNLIIDVYHADYGVRERRSRDSIW